VSELIIKGLSGMPLVKPGDDLVDLLAYAIDNNSVRLRDEDVLVIAQKIVSKAESRYVDLSDVTPGGEAIRLAAEVEKDPRLVEIILSESHSVLRHRPGLLIVRHRLGFVMANAGVDRSNLDETVGAERVLLLPADPEATAWRIHSALAKRFGVRFGVIINDSAGRPWRNGIVGIALGVAGLPAVRDMCGRQDLSGRTLQVTFTGFADGIAAAAGLAMGEANEGIPVVHVRGVHWPDTEQAPTGLLREPELDLFL